MTSPTVTQVFLAGIGNSGPTHWQSHWFRAAERAHWVEHADWDNVACATWIAELDAALRSIKGPKVLIAHSLACLLVAEWGKQHSDPDVLGAFLVSVPDPSGPQFPKEAVGFGSPLESRLPVPAIMVASANDPYGSLPYAQRVAAHWGIELVNIGEKGHINAKSELGEWKEGKHLFDHFVGSLRNNRG
ncbi:RBBP9/YdeN family alpha/beta hydrolase [Sorangium sp. So ce1024]|uniref:RBBP9/YdeN family alpha/beta hydrolase n=1 Tax=unclassified Sorangium TaxID=2621164 RepID=UPI003F0D3101